MVDIFVFLFSNKLLQNNVILLWTTLLYILIQGVNPLILGGAGEFWSGIFSGAWAFLKF